MGPGSSAGGEADQIWLWVVDLDQWESKGLDPATLSGQDRSQAGRLRDSRLGDRLLARRSVTRTILSQALGTQAADLVISRSCPTCGSSEHGRPSVAGSPIVFSVSSSGAVAAVAIAGSPVGVDIEIERSDVGPQFAALTGDERRQITAMPAERQRSGFFRLWTAKEAVIKAGGGTLGRDPATVDVSGILSADQAVAGDGDRQWHVRQLTVDRRPVGPVVLALADAVGNPVVRRAFDV